MTTGVDSLMSKGKYDGILLLTDVDATLLDPEGSMPTQNIEAARRFTGLGGLLGLATGRACDSAEKLAEKCFVNAPCIVCNGTSIYDVKQKRPLWDRWLPENIRNIMEYAVKRFPSVRIDAFAAPGVFEVNAGGIGTAGRERRARIIGCVSPENVPPLCHKVVFHAPHEALVPLEKGLRAMNFPGVGYSYSGAEYFEVLPQGVNKGVAAKVLAQLLGIAPGRVVGIGDYYNDIEMLRQAHIGAAPADAPEEVRRAADVVVCGCGQGAVADLIGRLDGMLK